MTPLDSARLPRPARADPSRTRTLVTAAAVVALGVHVWGLYRDHGPPSLRWLPESDKIEHLVGFGLPCFLVLVTLDLWAGPPPARPTWRATALVVALFAVHAVVSEVVQGALYSTRSGDPLDTLADLLGTGLGVAAYALWRRRRERTVRGDG